MDYIIGIYILNILMSGILEDSGIIKLIVLLIKIKNYN